MISPAGSENAETRTSRLGKRKLTLIMNTLTVVLKKQQEQQTQKVDLTKTRCNDTKWLMNLTQTFVRTGRRNIQLNTVEHLYSHILTQLILLLITALNPYQVKGKKCRSAVQVCVSVLKSCLVFVSSFKADDLINIFLFVMPLRGLGTK